MFDTYSFAYLFHLSIVCNIPWIFNAINDVNVGVLILDVIKHTGLLQVAMAFIRPMLAFEGPAVTILMLLKTKSKNKSENFCLKWFLKKSYLWINPCFKIQRRFYLKGAYMCVSVRNKFDFHVLSELCISWVHLIADPLVTSSTQSFVIQCDLNMVCFRLWLKRGKQRW